MISYKRDVLEKQSLSEVKISNLWKSAQKIVEYFKNNIPQRQIAKALQISSSTVHNIIKRLREIWKISVRKGQGRRPLLDARGPRTLRQHCLTHRHDSVIYINNPGILLETTVGKHNPPCHLQMPTKALSCKKEAICKRDPEGMQNKYFKLIP